MNNEKLDSLICDWIKVKVIKLDAIHHQHYENAALSRDKEKVIEDKILNILGDVNINDYIHFKYGINLYNMNIDNLKETIRDLKLNLIGIK